MSAMNSWSVIWIGHSLNSFAHHIESPIGMLIDVAGDPGEELTLSFQ